MSENPRKDYKRIGDNAERILAYSEITQKDFKRTRRERRKNISVIGDYAERL